MGHTATPVQVAGITDATTISAGTDHICATIAAGNVSCWGKNDDGQLGDGTSVASSTPVTVASLSGVTAILKLSGLPRRRVMADRTAEKMRMPTRRDADER